MPATWLKMVRVVKAAAKTMEASGSLFSGAVTWTGLSADGRPLRELSVATLIRVYLTGLARVKSTMSCARQKHMAVKVSAAP